MPLPGPAPSSSLPRPGIEIREVSKAFGAQAVVREVGLDIGDGEFFSLLGASGCGKTTLLRMIAGFERPDSGEIRVAGEAVTDLPPNRRRVNMMFQHYALFPHLSVAKNIGFGLKLARRPKAEVDERVAQAVATMHLGGMEHRRPAQLSGGQQQRVALARALIGNPSALLLDEPLGALDVKLRRDMQVELKRVQREVGTTFVYVTHDQDEALAMSDRIAVMNGGLIEQIGTPDAIYADPDSLFVADFVGKLNQVDGAALPAIARPSAVIGVRPESVLIEAMGADRSTAGMLRGRVVDVTYLGVSREVQVETGAGRILGLVPAAQAPIGVGHEVDVSWPAHSAFVFDRTSGERVR